MTDGWMLPYNWQQMTRNEQNAWSLTRYLSDRFPGFTFTVTMQPFNIRVEEDEVNVSAVQDAASQWLSCSIGDEVKWGEPYFTD